MHGIWRFCNERAWSNIKSYRERYTDTDDNGTDIVNNANTNSDSDENIGEDREAQELSEELENTNEENVRDKNDADGLESEDEESSENNDDIHGVEDFVKQHIREISNASTLGIELKENLTDVVNKGAKYILDEIEDSDQEAGEWNDLTYSGELLHYNLSPIFHLNNLNSNYVLCNVFHLIWSCIYASVCKRAWWQEVKQDK